MGTFIVRRLLQGIIILILVSLIVFISMRLLPGDPILLIVTSSEWNEFTQQEMERLRHEYGLDRPIYIQYVDWVSKFVTGDFGISILNHRAVRAEILRRALISLHIGLLAFILGNLIGIPMGIVAAVRRGKMADTVVTVLANIGMTVPSFWLGFLLVYLFGLQLSWLPTMGYTSPVEDFWLNTKQIIMPVICLVVFPISGTARQIRSSMIEVMHQDYIRTAWSKGLRERMIVTKHALKNGIMPIITLAGMHLSMIVGGSVLIETVFNIPGMGYLLVSSVSNQDYPYVQGITMIIGVSIVMINIAVDIIYGYVDPRVHYD
ncbi:MAG: ABC transporter permease [Dehalococcoidales bacterium]|nr:ABC transporter permease [Dehalococcoidales bacterium]